MEVEKQERGADTLGRIESFSDGVIAVIITIMVLEIRIPEQDSLGALRALGRDIAIYLLSFVFTGIYWLNHQSLLRRLSTATGFTQLSNLAFLFCLSLLPLSTRYVVVHGMSTFSVRLYATSLALIASAFYLVRLSVHKHLRSRDLLNEGDGTQGRRHLWSIYAYLVASVVAMWKPEVALVWIVVQTAAWVLPHLT